MWSALRFCLLVLLCSLASSQSFAQCTATGTAPAVTICAPASGATVSSPVTVTAATTSNTTVQYIQIYVDGVKVFETKGGGLNTQVSMTEGTHRLTVQAFNGSYFKQTESITVGNGSGSGVTVAVSPTSATVATGGTQQFTATVTGSSNTAVGWYVDSVAGGNSTAGTISTTGLYTAPAGAGSHTVKAVANADTSKSATAAVTVSSGSGSCTLNATDPSVTICQPANGATLDSPVHIVAGTTSSKPVAYMQIYVDTVKQYEVASNKLDTMLTLAGGTHRLTVQASNGTVFKQTINITVNGTTPPPPPGDAKSLTYKYGNGRTGLNSDEATLTPSNVNSTSFGKLGTWTLDGTIFAQPLYWPGLSITGKGTFDVLFVATEHDSLYALDANKPGSTALWKKSFLSTGVTTVPANTSGRTALGSEVGITGTPVIDEASGIIYVSVMTMENNKAIHRLHALDVHTGKEMSFSPVEITATVPGIGIGHDSSNNITFHAITQNQRAGLLLVNGVVYVAFGAYSDVQPYHGWIFAFDATNLKQISAWIATPDTEGASIWQAGSAPAADSDGNIYVSTADGTYQTGDWGDSILKLKIVNGKLDVVDWFTPYNQHCIDTNDLDLGASGPMLIPSGQSPVDLLISGSKEGRIYVLDQGNLGHMQSGSDSQIVQSIMINPTACGTSGFSASSSHRMYGSGAYWNGNAYLASVFGPLLQYKLGSDNKLTKTTQSSVTFTASGQSGRGPIPIVSSNGNSGGIVWLVNRNYSSGNSTLYAFDATDVSKLLYSSAQNSTRDSLGFGTVFTVPVVVNGRVFASASKTVKVYGLLK